MFLMFKWQSMFFLARKYFIFFPFSDLPSRKFGIQKVGSSYEHGESTENRGDWLFMSFT